LPRRRRTSPQARKYDRRLENGSVERPLVNTAALRVDHAKRVGASSYRTDQNALKSLKILERAKGFEPSTPTLARLEIISQSVAN
ncbi:MAG TPA: hypothetical protein VN702_21825, partial [Acetobacteraceae bacterium]|nr:hypothetical protein [Acetobacteraceae bacterium]